MDDSNVSLGPLEDPNEQDGAIESGHEGRINSQALEFGAEQARAARARVIEETTYRLTDLFAIISGRIEILSDKVPSTCREELLAIRSEVMKVAALNKRLLLTAQECRGEIDPSKKARS